MDTPVVEEESSNCEKQNLATFYMCATSLQQHFFHMQEQVTEQVHKSQSITMRLKVVIEESQK